MRKPTYGCHSRGHAVPTPHILAPIDRAVWNDLPNGCNGSLQWKRTPNVGPMQARGAPRVFISHGTHDDILPIDPCSRNIVRTLEAAGYAVVYDEFEGRHEIPPQVAQFAVHWFLEPSD